MPQGPRPTAAAAAAAANGRHYEPTNKS